jgi:succinate-semialdehyde dehydrogenase / glutarate-semialdehyde dehydrogenase
MAIATTNPATGETLKVFQPLSESEIDARIERAARAFRTHRKTPFAERAENLLRAAQILEDEKEQFARLMTVEMGKTIRSARSEVEKCALTARFYADRAEEFLSDEEIEIEAGETKRRAFVRYEPIGIVLAVMPWNFPFWQVFRFAAPALMAGNVTLLKHASNVPQCALAIEDIFTRAGFRTDAFQTLLIESKQVARVIDDARVAAVTLTGSEAAGADVGSRAGLQIKKTVLELGGSDPFVIMPSANLEQAVKTAVQARTINNGQSCIAAKRFIVHERIADEFEKLFVEKMKALTVGDPADERTDIGPLATSSIRETLEEQVRASVKAGAHVLAGGAEIEGAGFYYQPTVLTNIPENSPAACDELFGPVAAVFRVSDITEAIRMANATIFGLGSAAWTNDEREQERFIDGIEAGQVFINGMVASDPRLPFGGVKRSGYGRELGVFGIREFVNVKTVSIERAEEAKAKKTE